MYVKEGRAARQRKHEDGKSVREEHLQEAGGQTLLRCGVDGGSRGNRCNKSHSRKVGRHNTISSTTQTDIWTYRNTRNSRYR